jgi:hypothetical protein
MNRFATRTVRRFALGLAAVLVVSLAPAGSAGPVPGVSDAFGHTLAEWQVAWTSWFLGSLDIAPDANGNADVGHVVLLGLPNAPGDGTPASLDVTLRSGQGFVLPFQQWVGNVYTDRSVDALADVDDFRNMDITVKVDGVAVVTQRNVMDFYTEGVFDPPLFTDLPPGAVAWVFVQSVGMVHTPLRVGKHTITLDESISFADLGFSEPIVFHNTWNITVKPGR